MTEGRDESNEGPLNELNALRHRVEVLEAEHGKYEDLEDALRESEERFRLLMDQGTDAFVLHDVHGKIVEVNRTACEALG